MRTNQYYGSNISFIDMLFNIIIVFVLLFFASLMLINDPEQKKNELEAKADIIITMTWPDMSPHDIDIWIKVPDGIPIGYNHLSNSYVFLERDDLGISNNFIIKDNTKIALSPRREVVSFRGKMPGRYVANVQFFLAKFDNGGAIQIYDGTPIPVMVELIQINPIYKVLLKKEIILSRVKEERTAFAFTISDDTIVDIENDIEEPFILDKQGGYQYGNPGGR